MKSTLPKVLHPIGGAPLLGHAMRAAAGAGASETVVVIRHQRDRVADFIAAYGERWQIPCRTADQDEVKGTGRAVECGLEALPADLTGTIVVTMGDVPLLSAETISELTRAHTQAQAAVTVVTSVLEDAKAYGRIVRDAAGNVERIVEFKDASEAEREIREINSGIYAFDADVLRRELANVTTDNAQGEKYLTDVLELARAAGGTAPTDLVEVVDQPSPPGFDAAVVVNPNTAAVDTFRRVLPAGTPILNWGCPGRAGESAAATG